LGGAHLAQHLNFPVSRARIGSRQHNGKCDLATSFLIPRPVGLFTRALPDQMIYAVPIGEKRTLGKHRIHSSQIVALRADNRIPNKPT
jgi:hypothetical protein